MCAGRDRGCPVGLKVKGEAVCEWLLFSSGLIYLAQMYFSFYFSVCGCVHTRVCMCMFMCVSEAYLFGHSAGSHLITRTTQCRRKSRSAARGDLLAFLFYAGMI